MHKILGGVFAWHYSPSSLLMSGSTGMDFSLYEALRAGSTKLIYWECASKGRLEGWHVECQVSFRPVSYVGRLSKERQQEIGAKSATSAKKRPPHVVKADIDDWIDKKFRTTKKKEMRDLCWKGIEWRFKFVHGKVYEKAELTRIEERGVELISFDKMLKKLCEHRPGELFGGAGTDIAEIIRYYAEYAENAG